MQTQNGDLAHEKASCYKLWNRRTQCRDCISLQAFMKKTQLSKVENTNEGVYYIIAQYVEVDGHECVLEMVNRMDASGEAGASPGAGESSACSGENNCGGEL